MSPSMLPILAAFFATVCITVNADRALSSTSPRSSEVLGQFLCKEGVYYTGKCYFVILHGITNVGRGRAERLCGSRGASIADIRSLEHGNSVASLIRSKTTITGNTVVWLGMSYTASTSTFRFSSGVNVPDDVATSMRWCSEYPCRSNTHWSKVTIAVNSNEFCFMHYPSFFGTHGVVCQK